VLVPVVRGADKKPLKDLVVRYNELVELARQRKLPIDATGGSIATVTNFGTFGLTWATPIPLPEQTLVLGMGAGRRVPHWDEAKNNSCRSPKRTSPSASTIACLMAARRDACSRASAH
jgi:pyruvate/2-oxoglutarate dehydrogenase complex dihydrolipoamide acyltransferase (E2) component